jgi:hypothetical protein
MESIYTGPHPIPAPVAGTEADSSDMRRMGRVQELNVSPPGESIIL